MEQILPTFFATILGAVLAAIFGILSSQYLEKKKDAKQQRAFNLEFSLALEKLIEHLEEFEDICNSEKRGELDIYLAKPFVQDPIFHNLVRIDNIPGTNIKVYYEALTLLKEIDDLRKKPLVAVIRDKYTMRELYAKEPLFKKIETVHKVYLKDLDSIYEKLNRITRT